MKKIKIFISSVQKEFSEERVAIRDYLQRDALLRRFFEPFLFEDTSAMDKKAENVFLNEVRECDIYIGIFGNEYGREGNNGLSSTHKEFNEATKLEKYRIIFVKGGDSSSRHLKMQALIENASNDLIRRRFATLSELVSNIYSALIDYLSSKNLLRDCPFDNAICMEAVTDDISEEKVNWFLELARKARNFPLPADTKMQDVLVHLNLLKNGALTNAAILLFGKKPQRFLISSEVKCAHFHGTEVSKPIPSYQVYKGTMFDVVDQAVDFVLSKIDCAVGTREKSVQAPVEYEIPQEVVREAIVNAVAHRDYTSNGSVQVMLFKDRLEVWNPGNLPPTLTLKDLKKPHGSVPHNPLIAEPLYLTKYIERMGTGIRDMFDRCKNSGLDKPEFKITDGFVITIRRKEGQAFRAVGGKDTIQVKAQEAQVGTKTALSEHQVKVEIQPEFSTSPVPVQHQSLESRILTLLNQGDFPVSLISKHLGQKRVSGQLKVVLKNMIMTMLIELTIPDKPNSRFQKYRITDKGKKFLKQ